MLSQNWRLAPQTGHLIHPPIHPFISLCFFFVLNVFKSEACKLSDSLEMT